MTEQLKGFKKLKAKGQKEYLRIISIVCIFAFSLLPLLTLIFKISGKDFSFVINDPIFYDALKNSLLYSLVSSVIAIVLSTLVAYFLETSSLKCKKALVVLLTLGMLVPSLSIGLGIRVLFGGAGFLNNILGVNIEGTGMFGLIFGSVIVAFPSCFLIIYDALRYEDKRPYDVAEIMGINKFSTFFKVKLPYLKTALISAFFATFTLIFSDYGVPMEVANKVETLPMYLYTYAFALERGRGAIVGVLLLFPAIASFILDVFLKERTTNDAGKQLLKTGKLFNAVAVIISVLVAFLLFLPQISFVARAFFEDYPVKATFTLKHFTKLFKTKQFASSLSSSLITSVLVGVIGTVLAYTFGYLSARKEGILGKVLNFLAMGSIAVPGIVLGVGYMTLFKATKGFFYETIAIIVVVNIFHFLGSPYIMAKNFLSKINKDYEVIGETLGISKFKVIIKVLVPSSIGTLIEMFSYFFLNSMITISAVAFLCSLSNQPLAILISSYEKNGNFEMQAAISVVLLAINLLTKIILNVLSNVFSKKNIKEEKIMELNRYQFDVLTFFEKNGSSKYTQRFLADKLKVSVGMINKTLDELKNQGALQVNLNMETSITEEGLKLLEPYRVRKALVFAAGFGSRLAPVTLETPKPLVKVKGVRIIDTLLDALVEKGITNITIVRGYKKEKFDELLEKYPFITFVDNPEFNVTNNISSAMKVVDMIDRCYICEADLLISNKDIIRKYEYETNYLGAKVMETDDWCFKKVNGYIGEFGQGGEDCYQEYGISFWTEKDGLRLKNDLKKLYATKGGKEQFWDAAPLKLYKKDYKIRIRNCHKEDIVEIDNFSELVALDSSYENYPGSEEF